MISQSVIEELKFKNAIDDVISTYVRLERSGRDLKGLCPFHSEKTPSFYVHPSEGYFHCFGCGAGGDVITFIMKAENLSYPDALEFLANRAGVTLPEDLTAKPAQGTSKQTVMSINREAAKFYHACLMDPQTPDGLKYLRDERKMPMSLIKHFGLGYAPGGKRLIRLLRDKGYTYKQMLDADLIKGNPAKPEDCYETFRARMMIPMLDAGGNVVAFSGRRLDGEKMMKYVNTSDTPAFKKGKYIFALNFAKDHCAERLILCEGQMDVIALHGAGFPQAIATMGTAITADQARTMKRYTKSVVICYDSDEAGQRAADKAFTLLEEVGLETRILRIDGAKDPDELIRSRGRQAFEKLLDGSKTQFEYKFAQILGKYDLKVLEEKIRASGEITRLIAGFSSQVERELYVMKAAKELGVPVETLKNDVGKILNTEAKKKKQNDQNELLRQTQGYADKVNTQSAGNIAAVRAEEAILGIMMLRPEITEKTFKEKLLIPEDFVTEFSRRVFEGLAEEYKNDVPPDPGLLGEFFTADEMGRIFKMRSDRSGLSDNDLTVFNDCVKRLKNSKKKKSATTDELLDLINSKRAKKTADKNTEQGKKGE